MKEKMNNKAELQTSLRLRRDRLLLQRTELERQQTIDNYEKTGRNINAITLKIEVLNRRIAGKFIDERATQEYTIQR